MRQVILVYGPPLGGKSTWVRQHARPGDVVIDFDALAVEAGSPRTHDHERRFRAAASSRRMELERHVERMKRGRAFIIRTLGDPAERGAAADRLGAQLHLCDPGGAVCIERAHAAGRPPEVDEVIVRWYAQHWGARALARRAHGGRISRVRDHPGLS